MVDNVIKGIRLLFHVSRLSITLKYLGYYCPCLQHSPDKTAFWLFFISFLLFKCHISDHIFLESTCISSSSNKKLTNLFLLDFFFPALFEKINQKHCVFKGVLSFHSGTRIINKYLRTVFIIYFRSRELGKKFWRFKFFRDDLFYEHNRANSYKANSYKYTFIPCMWRLPLYGVQSPWLVVQET